MNSISKIAKNSTYLQITWNDGEESKFNYMWLRDNCPTAHDKDSRHRMFNILEVSKEINPKKYSLNDDGILEIEWSEGNHTSYYDPKWLRENCYTIKNKQEYVSPYHLWDNNLENEFSEAPKIRFPEFRPLGRPSCRQGGRDHGKRISGSSI